MLTHSLACVSWQPIPPSADYVPLGMVTTRTEEPPSIKMVHCLPRNWVEPSPQDVKMLWSDAGNSGKPGSIWAVGQLQLLGEVCPGSVALVELCLQVCSASCSG